MTSPDKPAPLVHEYKVWPSFFGALLDGSKTFEWRKDDRPQAVNVRDVLFLREWDPDDEQYTGRALKREVSYVLRAGQHGVPVGYICIGFRSTPEAIEEARKHIKDAARWIGAQNKTSGGQSALDDLDAALVKLGERRGE